MRILINIAAVVSLLFSLSAFALDLSQAKSKGLVGETTSGYLAAVKTPGADVTKLINRINGERKKKYRAIANKNGISLKDVEMLAGKKAVESTRGGNFFKAGGSWKKK